MNISTTANVGHQRNKVDFVWLFLTFETNYFVIAFFNHEDYGRL